MPSLLQSSQLSLVPMHYQSQKQEKSKQTNKQIKWKEVDFPLVREDWVRSYLVKLDTCNGMQQKVLRELAGIIAKPHSIIFERYWRT